MSETLLYGDRITKYSIAESERLSSKILIHVHPYGAVEVESPVGADAVRIKAAVQKRARWIFDHLDAAKDARTFALPREYIGGEAHFYLGRRYRLFVRTEPGSSSSVKLVRGRIEVTMPIADPAAVKRRLKAWYRAKAQSYFEKRLQLIVPSFVWLDTVPAMKLVRMERQWGSCSPSGLINLNPALIRAPRHCIDYVLTHELCHLQEHNHSKRFYALLQRHHPNWIETKKELDRLAELLLVE